MASCCDADFCDTDKSQNEFHLKYRDVLNKHYWDNRFLSVHYHGKTPKFGAKFDYRVGLTGGADLKASGC